MMALMLKWLCQETGIKMTGELICPVAIEQGMRFAIREGGRTIGAGVVSKILK